MSVALATDLSNLAGVALRCALHPRGYAHPGESQGPRPGLEEAQVAAECPFAMSAGQGPLGGSRSRPYRGKVVGLVLRTALLLVEYAT